MNPGEGPAKPNRPAPQGYGRAIELALDALRSQSSEQIRWLGAEEAAGGWRLPVFNEAFLVNRADGRAVTSAGAAVSDAWRVLALHYLAITARPERLAPEITFADLPESRTYAGVYRQRAIARLCGTFGRDLPGFRAAAASLGARDAEGGDAAFDFDLFPRVALRLIWHAGDEEFPPSATILLPPNIEAWFCTEDIVVLSERLASRLAGRPF